MAETNKKNALRHKKTGPKKNNIYIAKVARENRSENQKTLKGTWPKQIRKNALRHKKNRSKKDIHIGKWPEVARVPPGTRH